jgi:cytochrome P450
MNRHMVPGILSQWLPAWLPIPGRSRYEQARATIDHTLAGLIAQRCSIAGPADDLFTALQAKMAANADAPTANQLLHDEVVSLLIAGYETIASGLTWTLHLLAQHPAVLHKLQHEINAIVGQRTPTLADLSALHYLDWVLSESLRLYPPAWRITRTARHVDCIDGFHIPAGMSVLILVYALHRHPAFWLEPERFDPDRFDPARGVGQLPFAWLPFGAGSRQCMGRDMAWLEMQLILTTLLQQFDIAAANPQTPNMQIGIILKPVNGLLVRLAKRR